jgi:hypothetical protein
MTHQEMRIIADLRHEVEMLKLGLQEINDRMDSIPMLTELLVKYEDRIRPDAAVVSDEESEDLVG